MKPSKTLYLVVIIILFLFSVTGTAADLDDYRKSGHKDPRWSALVEAGFESAENGHVGTAMTFFQRAITNGCQDGLVFFTMAINYEKGNNYPTAKHYFEKAKSTLPKHYRNHIATKTIHEHLGRTLYMLNEIPAAKTELKRAEKRQGNNFTLMFLLGSIAKQEGNHEEVIDYYTRAMALPPPPGTDVTAVMLTVLRELGKSYFELKDYPRSLDAWNRLLAISPKDRMARKYKMQIERDTQNKLQQREELRILNETQQRIQ